MNKLFCEIFEYKYRYNMVIKEIKIVFGIYNRNRRVFKLLIRT
jgi:hypothetical protein